ncbi:hypothetical protein M427DRAFT_44953 [Gonapodya prolifera JEL478]|uniref:Cache domain-containing protein n=1 Tax=Gonapodya prolifera (strain JEL478) TaxID=1344416 RepID=A0A139ACI3_GONPJ|nr:hypothetical protein M427DRAFT_44953 [Gonapodya prolifera JEL478]|eukprot:KXS14526.1 hypothetical protein M427DRAFT_44953 [Gonapodya prolifera JEL478]
MADASPSSTPIKKFGVSLRLVIVALVVINVVLVASVITGLSYASADQANKQSVTQGTTSILDLAESKQRDTSAQVLSHMDSYISSIISVANITSSAVQLGTVDLEDYDRFGPFLALTVRGINKKLMGVTIFNNVSQNMVAVATLGPPDIPVFAYLVANKTCQSFFISISHHEGPVPTTNTSATYWRLQQNANGTFSLGELVARVWKRPWWSVVDRAPPNTISISNPTLAVGNSIVPVVLAQYLSFPIWDSQGNFVAGAAILFAATELSSQLDQLKAAATPNSLFYIIAPTGQMLGMSGLNITSTTSPVTDYIANSLELQTKLSDDLNVTNRNIIIISTKFDFSMIKDKTLNQNTQARTIISDVRVLQERFVEMLVVFANAVKREFPLTP